MRVSVPATAVSLCLMALAAAPGMAAPAAAQATSATAAPTTAAPATAIVTPDGSGSDAAARHAKRTGCLKEAKAKKLVGADKTSYIKDCVAH